jgi:hypothetical protein
MMFIGYESGTKGYRFFNPVIKKLVVSRDVIFDENQPWDRNNKECSTGQQETDTFIVHYDEHVKNSTIGFEPAMSESAGSPAQSGVGGGVVDPQEATPSQVGTTGSVLHLNKLCRHHLVRIQKVAHED